MVQPLPAAGKRAEDAHYFKSVADYIHLNPARAENEGGKIDAKAMEATWRLVSRGVRRQGQAPGVNKRGNKRGQSLDINIFIDSDS